MMRFLVAFSFLLAGACSPRVQSRPVEITATTVRVAVMAKDPNLRQLVEGALMTNGDRIVLVARADQRAVAEEQDVQASGRVADDAVVSIGNQLGAEWIIVADELATEKSFFEYGNSRYAIRLRVLDVERGVALGFSEVDGRTSQFESFSCDFACLQSHVVDMAVRRMLRAGPQG